MKQITLLILLFGFTINIYSQDRREEVRDKIESRKIAYLSDKLDLSPEDAEKFWPVYNSYNKEMQALRQEMRPLLKQEDISDEEAAELLNKLLIHEKNILDIRQSYTDRFTRVLGPKRTLKFFRSDREFKERMLRGIGERKQKMKEKGR
ncbi:MAG: hypothetical protein HKN67_11440 [Saprospiraceae bacterium]|nr:periplasmic heavy metal sensor [Bacteroidia bacterium]MBT8228808.1 periplasmic heavy metal sensor [Bacteroidia bacterium]NNF22545.1 hypothetical protein [Saprospiraceae bacterium]